MKPPHKPSRTPDRPPRPKSPDRPRQEPPDRPQQQQSQQRRPERSFAAPGGAARPRGDAGPGASWSYKLTIEYEGTRYSGWQEQRDARTVAGVLRAAAEEVAGGRVEIGGAGRTDAGVHALAQVAHLRAPRELSLRELFYGMNDLLPADVNLLFVEPVPARFHARHDAVLRSYVYQISTRRTAFGKRFVWWVKDELDEHAMARAAEQLAGSHDFASFCERPDQHDSTIVDVEESTIAVAGDLILYRIVASHFLWKMVRRVVGVLAGVGRGELHPKDMRRLLEYGSPEIAAQTAPPSGLFLEAVYYDADEPRRPLAPAVPVG